MTVFHLLRHGEHNLGGGVLAGRLPGVCLTERGRAEIEAVAARLGAEKPVALYSSPLQRTLESAGILSERLGLPIEFRDDLLELDFGEWTGTRFDDIRADPRWRHWNELRSTATIPGGETMRAVQQRAVEALFEMHRAHPEAVVAVVSHGDVIRAMLVFALGMPLDFFNRIEVGLGSISTVRIEPGLIRVAGINERPHLHQ